MNLNLLSFGTTVTAVCVFYATRHKFTEGWQETTWFLLVLWFEIIHTDKQRIQNKGTNRLTQTYKDESTTPVMCTQQPPVLH